MGALSTYFLFTLQEILDKNLLIVESAQETGRYMAVQGYWPQVVYCKSELKCSLLVTFQKCKYCQGELACSVVFISSVFSYYFAAFWTDLSWTLITSFTHERAGRRNSFESHPGPDAVRSSILSEAGDSTHSRHSSAIAHSPVHKNQSSEEVKSAGEGTIDGKPVLRKNLGSATNKSRSKGRKAIKAQDHKEIDEEAHVEQVAAAAVLSHPGEAAEATDEDANPKGV